MTMFPLTTLSISGVEVSSWAVEPSSSPNPEPNCRADDFFTVHIYYHDTYIPNAFERSASFMLERTTPYDHSKTQVAVTEWLDELDVEGNAYGCAIDVVVESCEILLDEVSEEDRKSLAMTVDIKAGPEYEHVDDTNMDMDMSMVREEEPYETFEEKMARMKEVETFLRTMKIIRPSKVDMDCHCSICSEEFDKSCSEQEVANLGCSHIFHGSCLVSWILEGKNSCPLCRSNFMPC